MWTVVIYLTFFFGAMLFPTIRRFRDMRNKIVRNLFIVYFVCIGTIIVLSNLIPDRRYPIPELQKLISKQEPGTYAEYHVFDLLRRLSPDSLPVQFRYIDLYKQQYSSFCPYHISDDFAPGPETRLAMNTYAAISCNESELSVLYLDSLRRSFPENAYLGFLEGKYFQQQGEFQKAAAAYHKTLGKRPYFDKSYLRLLEVYARDSEQLHAYVTAPNIRAHLPVTFRRTYFYHQGDILYYLETIAEGRIFSVSWMPFFAALVISAVWLYYIRNMDIFRPERWRDLIFVFILGTLCTFLCLPLYDFDTYTLQVGLNGDAVNDFLYCTFVIGLNEELVKFLPWIIFGLLARKFKEPYDYILYASAAALGFAFAENWMYLEKSGNIVTRFLMAVTSHMMDASIVAYGFILARFRFKKQLWKRLTPVLAFFVACLAHGFYDFWLLSSAVENYGFITILFFLLTLHLWFVMKNNAVNNSAFFNPKLQFGQENNLRILMYGILGAIMLSYVMMTAEYGADDANKSLYGNFNRILFFAFYVTWLVSSIRIQQGEWRPLFKRNRNFRFPNFTHPFFSNRYDEDEYDGSTTGYRDYQGTELRLFMSKSNRYLGAQFPVSGRCLYPVSIDGEEHFYVFRLNQDVHFGGMVRDTVIIRQASLERDLTDDKVEILMLLIPNEKMLERFAFRMRELRYVGKVYARPI